MTHSVSFKPNFSHFSLMWHGVIWEEGCCTIAQTFPSLPQHPPFPRVSAWCAAAPCPGQGCAEPGREGQEPGWGWHHSAKWNPAEKLVTEPSSRPMVLFISVVLRCLTSILRKQKSPRCAILPCDLLRTGLSGVARGWVVERKSHEPWQHQYLGNNSYCALNISAIES